jgi:hypothetical protein
VAARSWVPSRSQGSRPDSGAENDAETPLVADRSRMFRFF